MERYALAAFLKSAREMKEHGAFTFVREMAPIGEMQGGVQVTGLSPSLPEAKRRNPNLKTRRALRIMVRFATLRNDGEIRSPLLEPVLRHVAAGAVIFVRQEFSGHRDLDPVALGIGDAVQSPCRNRSPT